MTLAIQGGRRPYIGRFAPSPTGPLHDGSLLAAMASFLDARAHHGKWLLRIEDIDTPRVVPGADQIILRQLRTLGMHWDAPPTWQSQHLHQYQAAYEQLTAQSLVYGCACTRQELPWGAYPGTCRNGLPPGRQARAWRFKVPPGTEHFDDRWQGHQQQDVAAEVGDFIVRRADGLWAYQMVVVVDDGNQGITDIVRGEDLLDSTARQRVLARHLHLDCPRVMHIPVLMDDDGRKLSKQNHAEPLDIIHPLHTLNQAWQALGFPALAAKDPASFWAEAKIHWAQRFSVS